MSTRLYVGGLSLLLPEEELNQQLSNFGTVKKLEIKEKKDLVSGEVLKRFAFATLDASQSSIDQCIRSLQGKSLHGSELTLERAQESFIDRLNREREARAQGKTVDKTNNNYHQNSQIDVQQFNFGSGDATNTRNNSYGEDYSRIRPPPDSMEDTPRLVGQKRSRGWGEEEEEEKHKVPEELFPSSVYQEDQEDRPYQGDDNRTENDSRYRTTSPPPQKWAKMAPRYDPKKKGAMAAAAGRTVATDSKPSEPNAQQLPKASLVPTTVSADLTFTGASQGFSLLSMLEQVEPITVVAKDAVESTDAPVTTAPEASVRPVKQPKEMKQPAEVPTTVAEKKQPTEVKTYIKKSKFFVDIDDPEVEENLSWVYQEIPKSQLSKFDVDRPEIVKLYTEWHRKAQYEKRKDASGDHSIGQKPSRASSAVFEDEGEAAVVAAAYGNDGIGSEPATLATDSLIGAVQTVGPADVVTEVREGGPRARRRSRGRGRKTQLSSRGDRGGRGRTRGEADRGRCPG